MTDGGVSERQYLFVSAGGIAWGIAADAVRGVVHSRDWFGDPPVDVEAVLGLSATHDDTRDAVLLLRERGRDAPTDLPLLARGKISIRLLVASEILPLPEVVLHDSVRGVLTSLAVSTGHPAALLVEAEGLRALQQTKTSTS